MKQTSVQNYNKLLQYFDGSFPMASKAVGTSESSLRRYVDNSKETTSFVITCAQTETPVHTNFLKGLHTLCRELDAELLVIPYDYGAGKNKVCDTSIQPFLLEEDIPLHPLLKVMATRTKRPTTQNPLASREACTGEASGIFPHPRLALSTVPTPRHTLPKIQCTSGAVTLPNYGDSSAGQDGEFYHSIAACIVEVDGDEFHLRHVVAEDNGTFYDLDKFYDGKEFIANQRIEALIPGDTHVRWLDPDVKRATYTGTNSICKQLRPKAIYHHDLLDFYAKNHHHRDNFMTNMAKHKRGLDNAEMEVRESLAFLAETTPRDAQVYVIASNHNDALTRWAMETHFKMEKDWKNTEFLLKLQMAVVQSCRITSHGAQAVDLFKYCAEELMQDEIHSIRNRLHFLHRDQSHTVKDIELGYHGDKGANGARGSVRTFSKIGPKTIIGHSHSPKIFGSCYQVGTSSGLKLEYNSGPSSWLNTHAIIYPNGKRALINIINGKWKKE
jgi:hypothetical protein